MKTIFILLFVLLFIDCRAQEIEDVTAVQEGNSILVSYNLVDKSITPGYNISLFCSTDGGTSWLGPMVFVSGDVGADVLAGDNNQIIWDVLKEWDYLFGENIKFRLDAEFRNKTEFIGDSMIIDLRDSSIYKVVTIGDNMWMAENLKIRTKTGSACYDNKPENCIKYGRLYNWYTATKVCPNGWHLPSHDEINELVEIAGGRSLGARKLKSVEGWNEIPKKMRYSKTKVFSNNETGFNAISAGHFTNVFRGEGWIASFWTSTEASKLYPYSMGVVHYLNSVSQNGGRPKSDKYSIRCIKDKQE